MNTLLFGAAEHSAGDTILGLIVIGVIIWIIAAICGPGTPKGYQYEVRGEVRPR